jgi:hypothetical protein
VFFIAHFDWDVRRESALAACRGKEGVMSIIALLILVAIFFLVLYLIWLLPAPWRVRQIIQIVAIILGLLYLYQHPSLLHF